MRCREGGLSPRPCVPTSPYLLWCPMSRFPRWGWGGGAAAPVPQFPSTTGPFWGLPQGAQGTARLRASSVSPLGWGGHQPRRATRKHLLYCPRCPIQRGEALPGAGGSLSHRCPPSPSCPTRRDPPSPPGNGLCKFGHRTARRKGLGWGWDGLGGEGAAGSEIGERLGGRGGTRTIPKPRGEGETPPRGSARPRRGCA